MRSRRRSPTVRPGGRARRARPARRRRRGSCRSSSGHACWDSQCSIPFGLVGCRRAEARSDLPPRAPVARRTPRRATGAWRATLLLLNLKVVDDALDALGLPRELLGTDLLLRRLDSTVKVNSGVVGVNVHPGEVRSLIGDELRLHGGGDLRVVDVLAGRLARHRLASPVDGEACKRSGTDLQCAPAACPVPAPGLFSAFMRLPPYCHPASLSLSSAWLATSPSVAPS